MKHTAYMRDRSAAVSLLTAGPLALHRPDVVPLFIGGVSFQNGRAFPTD